MHKNIFMISTISAVLLDTNVMWFGKYQLNYQGRIQKIPKEGANGVLVGMQYPLPPNGK